MNDSIAVPNAGIVLLNSYIPMLFDRLGITADQQFTSPTNQTDAVHYVQYLVTGLENTEEYLLPLNKVLCGLDVMTPLDSVISISEDNKVLMDGLIRAAIDHWPAIGESSIDGFRGNWLVRDGLLTEQEDRWELRVEKISYDILINQAPFSFSIIKFPWMPKPLHINCPF